MSSVLAIARKESGDLLRSGRGLAWLFALSLVLSILTLLLVADTELSLLDNAQVVYMMMGTVTALGALLGAVLGADAIAGERERASLIPLLLAPLSARDIVFGKMGGLVVGWMVTYALALPYLWAVASTGQNLGQAIAYLALFGTPVVLGFGFFALGLSARLKSVRVALLTALIVLIVLASPLMLGPSLRQTAIGKTLDAINPFSAALNSYDSAVIDSQPFSIQSSRLLVLLAGLALAFVFGKRSVDRLEI